MSNATGRLRLWFDGGLEIDWPVYGAGDGLPAVECVEHGVVRPVDDQGEWEDEWEVVLTDAELRVLFDPLANPSLSMALTDAAGLKLRLPIISLVPPWEPTQEYRLSGFAAEITSADGADILQILSDGMWKRHRRSPQCSNPAQQRRS